MSESDDCNLLGPLGIAVQLAITVVCAVALIAVWLKETPRRAFLTWAFDISKQVVGSVHGKCWNIMQAKLLVHSGSIDRADECVWYLMGNTTECFATTFLCWGANSFIRPILSSRCGIDIGSYESEQSSTTSAGETTENSRSPTPCVQGKVQMWLTQCGIWVLIITVVRMFVTFCLFESQNVLYDFFAGIFNLFHLESGSAKTIFAVLLWPAFSDVFQIVVQDRFLKYRAASEPRVAHTELRSQSLVEEPPP